MIIILRKKNNMFISRVLISILFIATLASCGGGSGGSGSSGGSGGSGSSSNESADGYWEGYSTESDGSSYEIDFLSSNGKYIAFDSDFETIISGSLSISRDKLSSRNSKSYDGSTGDLVFDGIEVDGVVNSKSKIIADMVQSEYDIKSEISLDYNALWEEKISYSDLSGSWDFLDENGDYNNSLQVDSRGNFSSEYDGCTTSGRVTIPNNMQSIVSIEFNITGDNTCYLGNYTGLGLLNDGVLIMIGTNNQYAVGALGIKSDQNY
jgi:hypothetical protein